MNLRYISMGLTDNRRQAIIAAFELRASIPWNELFEKSSEVVLFGSWALGKETPRSDIDLLCVDFRRRIKTPGVDILAYPKSFIESEAWLSSELAVHIAHYGVMLKGDGSWRQSARITSETLTRKKEQVLIRAVRLSCSLNHPSTARSLELIKLRRDLQRLRFLSQGAPTPPTALLDEQWAANEVVRDECSHQLVGASKTVLDVLTELSAEISQLKLEQPRGDVS